MKKYKVVGGGGSCPRCKSNMEVRQHDKLRPKQKKAPYYFSQWDYCTRCNYIKLYEDKKVWNNGLKRDSKNKLVYDKKLAEEWADQMRHMREISKE